MSWETLSKGWRQRPSSGSHRTPKAGRRRDFCRRTAPSPGNVGDISERPKNVWFEGNEWWCSQSSTNRSLPKIIEIQGNNSKKRENCVLLDRISQHIPALNEHSRSIINRDLGRGYQGNSSLISGNTSQIALGLSLPAKGDRSSRPSPTLLCQPINCRMVIRSIQKWIISAKTLLIIKRTSKKYCHSRNLVIILRRAGEQTIVSAVFIIDCLDMLARPPQRCLESARFRHVGHHQNPRRPGDRRRRARSARGVKTSARAVQPYSGDSPPSPGRALAQCRRRGGSPRPRRHRANARTAQSDRGGRRARCEPHVLAPLPSAWIVRSANRLWVALPADRSPKSRSAGPRLLRAQTSRRRPQVCRPSTSLLPVAHIPARNRAPRGRRLRKETDLAPSGRATATKNELRRREH